MKTNQILNRKMGDFNVNKRTSDEMFNATELLKQWNDSINAVGRKGKRIDDFLKIDSTQDFLSALKEEILNTEDSRHLDLYKSSKGKNGGTWMHPILFIKFAMWINPRFEVKVIKFVYDELIKHRHDAGDNYRLLSQSVSKIVDKAFLPVAIQNIAKAINYVVFNKHVAGIRNTEASEEALRELSSLELKLSELIDDGFITTYEQLLSYLRKTWNNKHQPKLLKQSA